MSELVAAVEVYWPYFLVGSYMAMFIHEAGHLLMARWLGLSVEYLQLGSPPLLFRSSKVRLGLLPVGEVDVESEKTVGGIILMAISGAALNFAAAFLMLLYAFALSGAAHKGWLLMVLVQFVYGWSPLMSRSEDSDGYSFRDAVAELREHRTLPE